MKKSLFIFSFGLFIFLSQNVIAQKNKNFSDIKAKIAWWQTGNSKISITDAIKGSVIRERLTLNIELQPQILEKASHSTQKFEVKWYRYGSRGLYLTDSFVQTINRDELTKSKKPIVIKSTRKNVQAGWWIVTVMSYYDNGLVTFNGKSQYKIKVL